MNETLALIRNQKLLPLYYHDDVEVSKALLQVLYRAGIRAVEYTNRGVHALDNFKAMKAASAAAMPGLQLGIGTIKTVEAAKSFIAAGADFVVSPCINEEVCRTVQDAGLLCIPGCMTPTEIGRAEAIGINLVKLFPGSLLGPGFVPAVKELFPQMLFMPTGGVEAKPENLAAWFRSGVVAVGLGSKLFHADKIAAQDYDGIGQDVASAWSMVQQAANV